MQEVRTKANIERLQTFKNVAESSAWYYRILDRLLANKIDKTPLTCYMADQIKNVLESG